MTPKREELAKHKISEFSELRLKSLQLDAQDKEFWTANDMYYYKCGTLFTKNAKIASQNKSTEGQASVAYLLECAIEHFLDDGNEGFTWVNFTKHHRLSAKQFSLMVSKYPELRGMYEFCCELIAERVINRGFKKDGAPMAKFLLTNNHGMDDKKVSESRNLAATEEEIVKLSTEELQRRFQDRFRAN